MKLPQSQLGLDPGMGKFGNRTPLPINPLGFLRLHLLGESLHFRCFHGPDNRAAFVAVLRTTLRLKRTGHAHLLFGPILMLHHSRTLLLAGVLQGLSRRTTIAVLLRLIDKGGRIKRIRHATPFHLPRRLLFPFPQGSHQIDSLSGHVDDVLPAGKAAVHHHLLRLVPEIFFDPFDRPAQLPVVTGALADPGPHDDLVRRLGGQLHVIAGRVASVGLLHDPGLRFRQAHPRRLLLLPPAFVSPNLAQLLQRLFQPALPFARRPFPCSALPLGFIGLRIAHRLDLLARRRQMRPHFLFPPKTVRSRTSLDLGAIVHHPLQTHQTLRAQQAQHLHEQIG